MFPFQGIAFKRPFTCKAQSFSVFFRAKQCFTVSSCPLSVAVTLPHCLCFFTVSIVIAAHLSPCKRRRACASGKPESAADNLLVSPRLSSAPLLLFSPPLSSPRSSSLIFLSPTFYFSLLRSHLRGRPSGSLFITTSCDPTMKGTALVAKTVGSQEKEAFSPRRQGTTGQWQRHQR